MESEAEISSAISTPLSTWRNSGTGTSPSKTSPRDDKDRKRRKCISTACIACRKRKSKCDGAQPACAACVSVYNTECIYDPSSDHRRKGVSKKRIDHNKLDTSTLLTIVQAILNFPEEDIPALVAHIRAFENLDEVANSINNRMKLMNDGRFGIDQDDDYSDLSESRTFESRLASRVSELKLDQGTVRMIGGTSNLLFSEDEANYQSSTVASYVEQQQPQDAITSWTTVTSDKPLIIHLLNHYFTWHYPTFPILPKESFYQQFYFGIPPANAQENSQFCTSLLLNAMLAIGCHFTSVTGARANPADPSTAGDHFFHEAKRQVYEQDELVKPNLATIQALALMSLREAGCGRESRGWVYSGMAFRMVCDLGLNFHTRTLASSSSSFHPATAEEMEDARRVTFWGCFIVDKCWSLYLGRLPMFQLSANTTTPKFDVFPIPDSEEWCAYYDTGFDKAHSQASRTRAISLRMSELCEISGDIISCFYHPQILENPSSKAQEMKNLNDIRSRLEKWNHELSGEFHAKEGVLSSVLIMHMMFQLLHIHLFRPFLKYNQKNSPLPSHVSPRRFCTQAATEISELFRLYSNTYGLRQIVNIAVYICHSACTIHLLNLPEEQAKRDIIYGFEHLEEIAEGWLCARRTLYMLKAQARRWSIQLPEDAAQVLLRISFGYESISTSPVPIGLQQSAISGTRPQSQSSGDEQSHRIDTSNYMSVQPDGFESYDYRDEQSVFGLSQGNSAFTRAQKKHISPSLTMSILVAGSDHAATEDLPPEILNSPSSENHSHRGAPSKPGATKESNNKHNSEARKRKEADMFGGVEALLRDSHDWLLNDQASLASGFDNWALDAGRHNQMKF